MRDIRRIIIHCSATDGGTIEGIRRYHMEVNGWSDIGYHYVIHRDGSVHKGRPIDTIGAHCENHNYDSIGICLIGDTTFALCQFLSLRGLVVHLMREYGMLLHNIKCHYQLDQHGKTCPNFKFEEFLSLFSLGHTIKGG